MTNGKLSEVARHVIVPTGIVSTGWPSVRDTAARFGVTYDPWQDGLGRLILAKRKDGTYAASIGGVVISIPRQVGKTFLIGTIMFALCMLFPGLTVLWTAHRLRTANETFAKMKKFATKAKIKPHIETVRQGAGDQVVVFTNGSRILFGARERGFGRGFDDVDVVVFDEAQILTDAALDDMVPATNTAKNPLVIFTGTPPKPEDPGEVFTRLRADALAGEAEDTAYVEISADEGADPRDREQWGKANPSYPTRTPAASMLRLLKLLGPESFIREGYGIWDPVDTSQTIPAAAWAATTSADSVLVGSPVFALEVSEDRAWTSIAAVGFSSLGGRTVHGERIESGKGTEWAPIRCAELVAKWGGKVVVVKGTPASSLVKDLKRAGLTTSSPEDEYDTLVLRTTEHVARACGELYDAVIAGPHRFVHRQQDDVDLSVRMAVKKDVGDGAWVFSRRKSTVDISSLMAMTVALGEFVDLPPPKPAGTSVVEDDDAGFFRPTERLQI